MQLESFVVDKDAAVCIIVVSSHLVVEKEVVAATAATRVNSLVVDSFLFLLSPRNFRTVCKDFRF